MATAREQAMGLCVRILEKDFDTLHQEWLERLKVQGYTPDSLAVLEALKTMHEYWFAEGKRYGGAEVARVANKVFA